jgi:membrane associated rhomboid family serine protease
MSNYLDESGYLNYFLAMSPIIIGHLAVPPLNYLRKSIPLPEAIGPIFEIIYDIIGPDILTTSEVEDLVLDPLNCPVHKRKRWLTHMFVHVDYNHLLSNLISAIQLGYPIYVEVLFFYWATFIRLFIH